MVVLMRLVLFLPYSRLFAVRNEGTIQEFASDLPW